MDARVHGHDGGATRHKHDETAYGNQAQPSEVVGVLMITATVVIVPIVVLLVSTSAHCSYLRHLRAIVDS